MNSAWDRRSAEVCVKFLKQRGIGEIGTVLPPIAELLGAVVGRHEIVEKSQAIRLAKGKRVEQQSIDDAENAGVCANADGEGRDGECCVPRPAGPEPERISEVPNHFGRHPCPNDSAKLVRR